MLRRFAVAQVVALLLATVVLALPAAAADHRPRGEDLPTRQTGISCRHHPADHEQAWRGPGHERHEAARTDPARTDPARTAGSRDSWSRDSWSRDAWSRDAGSRSAPSRAYPLARAAGTGLLQQIPLTLSTVRPRVATALLSRVELRAHQLVTPLSHQAADLPRAPTRPHAPRPSVAAHTPATVAPVTATRGHGGAPAVQSAPRAAAAAPPALTIPHLLALHSTAALVVLAVIALLTLGAMAYLVRIGGRRPVR